MNIIPTEVKGIKNFEIALIQHIFNTAKHSYNVHYNYEPYRQALEDPDPDIPHDIVGKHNKYEPIVAVRLALEYVNDRDIVSQKSSQEQEEWKKRKIFLIQEGVGIHRQQYHHLMWANSSIKVPKDSRLLSGADAICSMLENRKYQGGVHSWEEIEKIIAANKIPYQRDWMKEVYDRMRKIPQPNLAAIKSLRQIPKSKEISTETHDIITGRAHEVLHQFEHDHCYNFYKNSESIIREILK